MPPSQPTRNGRHDPPAEHPVSLERDKREGLTFMRLTETITLGPDDRFVMVPGPKGHGWSLLVQSAPQETVD